MSAIPHDTDGSSARPNAAGQSQAWRATDSSLQPIRDDVPVELRSMQRWVCWDGTRLENGKLSKAPINAITGANAMSNNPSTWGTFEQACELALHEERAGGLGLVLTNSDYWALDLDHVVDLVTGEVAPAARAFLCSITSTYIERSPSGDGLHVIYRGARPHALVATKAKDAFGAGKHLEVFGGSSGRYITMTGQVWDAAHTDISEASSNTIEAVLAMFPPEPARKVSPMASPPLALHEEERKARMALQRVSADDYDTWVFVGMALAATFPEAVAKALWIEWSQKSAKYDVNEIEKHWRSFHDRPGGKTIAYIYWLADCTSPGWRTAPEANRRNNSGASNESQSLLPAAVRRGASAEDVLDRWQQHGPLIHAKTGIRAFDEMTGGGPVFGTRFYLLGAPDAGKTALVVQILDEFVNQGLAVGMLAVDEDPEDLLQRFLQRRGWSRQQCESRKPIDLEAMRHGMEGLTIRFYDSTFSIEEAGVDLARFDRRLVSGRRSASTASRRPSVRQRMRMAHATRSSAHEFRPSGGSHPTTT